MWGNAYINHLNLTSLQSIHLSTHQEPGVVAQAYYPNYSERTWFKTSPDKKFKRPHLNQWLVTVTCTCYLSLFWEVQIERLQSRPCGRKAPISKITSARGLAK
jgi:hypothetical protein